MRTVAEGQGDTLYVGTTRNSIVQGSVHMGFSLLVQVSVSVSSSSQRFLSLPIRPSALPAPVSSPAWPTPHTSPLPAPLQRHTLA